MGFHKSAHRTEKAVAKTCLMRAAGRRRNEVNKAFAHGSAELGPDNDPRSALPFVKALGLGIGPALRFKGFD